jgi:hypothetical protein
LRSRQRESALAVGRQAHAQDAGQFRGGKQTPLAVKSDRLVGADNEIAPDKATVKTVKVAFPPPAASKDAGLVAAQKKWRRPTRACEGALTPIVTTKRGIDTAADAGSEPNAAIDAPEKYSQETADNYLITVVAAEE